MMRRKNRIFIRLVLYVCSFPTISQFFLCSVQAVTLFEAAFMLVTYEVEQEKLLSKSSTPVRIGIACLSHPPQPLSAQHVAVMDPNLPPLQYNTV